MRLKTFGRNEEAVSSYRSAIGSAPSHADAYYALANLKTYRFTDDEIAAMQRQLDVTGQSIRNLVHFHFSLGKAFEDRKDYDASFHHYRKGTTLNARNLDTVRIKMDGEFTSQKLACTAEFFQEKAGAGCTAPDPILYLRSSPGGFPPFLSKS